MGVSSVPRLRRDGEVLSRGEFESLREAFRMVLVEGVVPYHSDIASRLGLSRQAVSLRYRAIAERGLMPHPVLEARGWFAVTPVTVEAFLDYARRHGEDISDIVDVLSDVDVSDVW